METCKIQWIDENGQPTPDSHPAVAIAHAHKAQRGTCTGVLVSYTPEITDSFPVCQQHLDRVTPAFLYPAGMWEFTTLDGKPLQIPSNIGR